MTQAAGTSHPSPEFFFAHTQAFRQTVALAAALELDIFSKIGKDTLTAKDLAERIQASPRGVRIFCDFLSITHLLQKSGDAYSLPPASRVYLDRTSPDYLGNATIFLIPPELSPLVEGLVQMVRLGRTIMGEKGTTEKEFEGWVDFARAMVPMMAPAARQIADLLQAEKATDWKVLDIAAGHGIFGIELARRNPSTRIVALDWPKVIDVARENAAQAGLASRYSAIIGDAFAIDLGSEYDVVLLTNFLHHFDVLTNEGLLAKVHAALKPGGRAVTLEFVPNDDRVSPPAAASFSLFMLEDTPGGDAYTFKELDSMFRNAGFKGSTLHALQNHPEAVVIATK